MRNSDSAPLNQPMHIPQMHHRSRNDSHVKQKVAVSEIVELAVEPSLRHAKSVDESPANVQHTHDHQRPQNGPRFVNSQFQTRVRQRNAAKQPYADKEPGTQKVVAWFVKVVGPRDVNRQAGEKRDEERVKVAPRQTAVKETAREESKTKREHKDAIRLACT